MVAAGVRGVVVYEVNEEDQRDPELLQMYFESFKHMTTLSTASAAVVAVVSGRAASANIPDLALAVLLLTVGILGICLVISLLGMRAATRYTRSWRSGATYDLDRKQSAATRFFIGGLLGFALNIFMLAVFGG